MAVSGEGTAHILFSDYGDIYYTYRQEDGEWLYPANLSQDYQISGGDPDLAISPTGMLHLAWIYEGEYDLEIYYAYRLGEAWSQPIPVTEDEPMAHTPILILPPDGDVILIWNDADYITTRMLSTSLKRLTQDEDALLSQTLTIPPGLSNPTLSFLYQLSGASEMAGTGLEVMVEGAGGPDDRVCHFQRQRRVAACLGGSVTLGEPGGHPDLPGQRGGRLCSRVLLPG